MPYDINTTGSPLWWIDRLNRRLEAKRNAIKLHDDYYDGRHRLAFATTKYREAFGGMFDGFADNWCDLVVDAAEERLNVQGFRFDDGVADKDAWRFWQANSFDNESRLTHTESLVQGRAFVSVWVNPDDDTLPLYAPEHPSQVVVAHAAGNRRQRLAALKRWTDDDGYERATLYMPDKIYRFRSRSARDTGLIIVGNYSPWVQLEQDGELANPLGVVPIVPFNNRQRMLNDGQSELARVIPLQDAVNKLMADMLVAAEYGAAPQRWATGIEIPVDPITKQPVKVFENLVSRLMASERTDTRFGQFDQTDLQNFVRGIEMIVQHIASQSRTPPHYFYLSGQFPSGESIKSAETGLVAKVRRKQTPWGESWEEVTRLGFGVTGDVDRMRSFTCETIWGDPESRSESEHVDAVMKQQALGIPNEALWEELGKTPQQIARFNEMIDAAGRAKPVATSPDEMTFEDKVNALAAYVRAGFDPEEASKVLGLPPVKHTGLLPVTVQPPDASSSGNGAPPFGG